MLDCQFCKSTKLDTACPEVWAAFQADSEVVVFFSPTITSQEECRQLVFPQGDGFYHPQLCYAPRFLLTIRSDIKQECSPYSK